MKHLVCRVALLVASSLCGNTWAEADRSSGFLNIDAAPAVFRSDRSDVVSTQFNQVSKSLRDANGGRLSIRIESSINQLGVDLSQEQVAMLRVFQMALLGELMAYPGEIHSVTVLGVRGIDDRWIKTLLSRKDITHINITDLDAVTADAFSGLATNDAIVRVIVCRCSGVVESRLRDFVRAERIQVFGDEKPKKNGRERQNGKNKGQDPNRRNR